MPSLGQKARSTLGRIEDFVLLTHHGEHIEQIAMRLGVSRRTLWRYKKEIRENWTEDRVSQVVEPWIWEDSDEDDV